MKKVSKSPQRYTFQKDRYVERQISEDKPVSEDYLDMFDKMLEEHKNKFSDPTSHKNNMEYDLLTTDWILEKVRSSDSYAQNLYAAMCNMEWRKRELWQELKEENLKKLKTLIKSRLEYKEDMVPKDGKGKFNITVPVEFEFLQRQKVKTIREIKLE
jgi:transposase-like protein